MTRSFRDIDTALEMAFSEAKSLAKRMTRGRVMLVIEKVDGRVVDYRTEREGLTTQDIERLMRERPHKEDR